jgi:hypothetical protein
VQEAAVVVSPDLVDIFVLPVLVECIVVDLEVV